MTRPADCDQGRATPPTEKQRELLRVELMGMFRDELNVIARKVGIPGYRRLRKEELVALLVDHGRSEIGDVSIPWWGRHHNHAYGVATLVSLLVAVVTFTRDGFDSTLEQALEEFRASNQKVVDLLNEQLEAERSSVAAEYDVLVAAAKHLQAEIARSERAVEDAVARGDFDGVAAEVEAGARLLESESALHRIAGFDLLSNAIQKRQEMMETLNRETRREHEEMQTRIRRTL